MLGANGRNEAVLKKRFKKVGYCKNNSKNHDFNRWAYQL